MKKSTIHDGLMLVAVIAILYLVSLPYIGLIIACSLILIYAYKKNGIKTELGFNRPKGGFLKTALLGMVLAFGISLISGYVLLPIIEQITGVPLDLGPFKQLKGNPAILISSLIIGWIVGGFLEEVIFRAFMITRFVNHLPYKVAAVVGVIIPSIIFGSLHAYQGPSGQILTGCVGVMLALIYLFNKRNIWLIIFTHGFVNTCSMLFLYFGLFTFG